jgi:hypothetical protein
MNKSDVGVTTPDQWSNPMTAAVHTRDHKCEQPQIPSRVELLNDLFATRALRLARKSAANTVRRAFRRNPMSMRPSSHMHF